MKKFENVDFIVSDKEWSNRVLVGIPMTGVLRCEWHLAYMSQVIPCNFAHATMVNIYNHFSPIKFLVADARNLIAKRAIEGNYEWLIFIDHDVILTPVVFATFNDYMRRADTPVVGGLYFTRSVPSEPLVYRGRGNSFYGDWKIGDKVWVDGMGFGCHLIHMSLIRTMWEESEWYKLRDEKVKRIFESPSGIVYSPQIQGFAASRGTEDLPWYARVKKDKILEKAGWPEYQEKEFPFLCDTNLFCKHIDFNGKQFPACGEEKEFLNVDSNT